MSNDLAQTDAPFGSFMQSGDKVLFDSPQAVVDDSSSAYKEADPYANANPFNSGENATPTGFPPFNIQNSNNQTEQTAKYKIFDLFWLINPKFYSQQQPIQSEAHVVIMSYNVDFGNLRISFFQLTKDSIQGNLIYFENLKRLVTGTVYPASAFNICNSPTLSMTCLEQLFKQIQGATWQQERPKCVVEKSAEIIRFTINDPKYGNYFYDFKGWQYKAFLYACNFIYTEGFRLFGQKQLFK
jgi:hypothetical protein